MWYAPLLERVPSHVFISSYRRGRIYQELLQKVVDQLEDVQIFPNTTTTITDF